MKKQTFYPVIYLFLLLLSVSSCEGGIPSDDSTPGSGHPLAPGEVCYIGFSNSVPDVGEATTRAIPEGKRSVLHDFTNRELKGQEGSRAGWVSGEVRTAYDEDVRRANIRRNATTRSFDRSRQLFGANSKFRMLVFAGTHNGTVNMDSPVANMVCQVNDTGTGASFISPTNQLGLLKGRYTFICFPADEKYNKWQVGQTEGYQIAVGADEDFVSMKLENQNIDNTNYQVDLSKFVRFGYELTVKFSVNEELGYLLFPQKELYLTVSDDGSGTDGRIINTGCTFDLKTQRIVNYNGNTAEFKDTLVIDKAEKGQTFTPVANFLMCNPGASQKLTISYPQLTVKKPAGTDGSKEDSVFAIRAGKFTTLEAVTFEAGKSYTITLAIGEQVKGILVRFQNEAGKEHNVIFARSQLYYDKSAGKWGIGKEQCDYGYNENGVAPNTGDSKLVTGNINYYFMYGCLDASITADIGNSTNNESGGMLGYYSGSSDLNTIGRDPCAKLGKDWQSPTRDIFYWMGYVGGHSYNGSVKSKSSSDFLALDENGNRLVSSANPNPYWGTYTPTDGRSNKTPVKGMWIGLSAANKDGNNTSFNGRVLFLPAAGSRSYGRTSVSDVSSFGYYWSSQQYSSSGGQRFYFYSSNYYLNGNYRYHGFSVRCCLPE